MKSLRPFKDGTRRTLEGIDNLLAEKERTGSRVSIIVKPTIMEQNYRGLPALVRHFGKNSTVQVNFQPYIGDVNRPYWVKDMAALKDVLDEIRSLQKEGYFVIASDHVLDGFMQYFSNPPEPGHIRHLDMGGHKRNCDIGLRSMFIFPNGDVRLCDYLGQAVGNVHKQSLSDIYYGGISNGQRKRMVYCDIDCQRTCQRPIPLSVKARIFCGWVKCSRLTDPFRER